jgi:transposase
MMLELGIKKIYAYGKSVDMRKSFDGLLSKVREYGGEDPLSGNLYVFVNRRGNYMKSIYWDRTGYCIFAKRLERGRFNLQNYFSDESVKKEVSGRNMKLILDGIFLGKRMKMR